MQGLEFTIFENLDVSQLSLEEVQDCLFYLENLIEHEENPIEFVKYQSYRAKLLDRLIEVKK
ncbi:MAG: hypothetical protein ACO1OF_15030 [Adhaeribacter sp.]